MSINPESIQNPQPATPQFCHNRSLDGVFSLIHLFLALGVVWAVPLRSAHAQQVSIDLRSTPADITIYPELQRAYGGVALTAGDLDGNGIDEIIIGSPFANGERGRVDIVYNPPMDPAPQEWDLAQIPPGLEVTSILGSVRNDWFGYSVAVGDYNGDGLSDLAVGAPNAEDHVLRRRLAGSAYVYFGGGPTLSPGEHDCNSAQIILHGAGENDGAGTELAIGDLNGDGIDDLVIAAPFGNRKKTTLFLERAYVSYGSEDRRAGQFIDLLYDYDLLLLNGSARDYGSINSSAYTIQDIIADPVPDLIVGSQYNLDRYGYVHILRGGAWPSGTVLDLDKAADFVIRASRDQDAFGAAVGAGDVNGDGIVDLVVGAPGGFGNRYGRVFLLLFNTTPQPTGQVRLRIGTKTPYFDQLVLRDERRRQMVGRGLAVGDCSGDGIDDIVVGSVYGREPDNNQVRGRVYVLAGRPDWPTGLLEIVSVPDSVMVFGGRKNDELGLAVSLGDFGGGPLAMLTSAWRADGPGDRRRSSGEIYLFYQALQLAFGTGPLSVGSHNPANSRSRELYFLSRSWMGGTGRVGQQGNRPVGQPTSPADLLRLRQRWR